MEGREETIGHGKGKAVDDSQQAAVQTRTQITKWICEITYTDCSFALALGHTKQMHVIWPQ